MSTQGQQFEIHIRSNSSSAEEWKRAMEAPSSELRSLTEEQTEIAKRFGISEEEYARGELASIYGRQRLRTRGQRLGGIIEPLLGNKPVAIWLSPEGKQAIRHIVEEKESFRAFVESVDELGMWLRLQPRRGGSAVRANSLLLLKWTYLATAQVEAEPSEREETNVELIH